MKRLTIGQVVRVTRIAEVGYPSDDRREVITCPVEPFLALIVGQVVKYTGRYGGGRQLGWGEYQPGYLVAEKRVTLWEVRTGMVNKRLMVRDEDLEPVDEDFTLPNRAGRVRRIYGDPPIDVTFNKPLLLTYQPGAGDD